MIDVQRSQSLQSIPAQLKNSSTFHFCAPLRVCVTTCKEHSNATETTEMQQILLGSIENVCDFYISFENISPEMQNLCMVQS